MGKFWKFLVELFLVAILVGWLFLKAPDVFDSLMPWIFAAIILHILYEYVWETDHIRAWRSRCFVSKGKEWGLFALVCIAICAPAWFLANHEVKRIIAKAHPPVPAVSSPADETATELAEVNELICKRDEWELRQEFDFPDMLKFNISNEKSKLAPQLMSEEESAETAAFFADGAQRIDTRYGTLSTVNNMPIFVVFPGKIGRINTSRKYIESRKELSRLKSSAALPSAVTGALREFDEDIEKDSVLMIDSLNRSLEADPRNILQDGDRQSLEFFGHAQNLYWESFIPLRNSADVVSIAVRKAIEERQSTVKQQ